MPMVFPTGHHHGGIFPEAFLWMFAIGVVLTLLYIYLSRHFYRVYGKVFNYKKKWEPNLRKAHTSAITYVGLVLCTLVPIANIALPLALLIVYFDLIANTPEYYQTDLKFINWLIK
jgi:ABC-type Fe3+ transport system permease subunit